MITKNRGGKSQKENKRIKYDRIKSLKGTKLVQYRSGVIISFEKEQIGLVQKLC